MPRSGWNIAEADDLFEAILRLQNIDEARKFLRDLLTESEIVEFTKRWRVAQLLAAKVSYKEIEAETGMSSTTIARIKHWLTDGPGGYRLMIDRMVKAKKKQ